MCTFRVVGNRHWWESLMYASFLANDTLHETGISARAKHPEGEVISRYHWESVTVVCVSAEGLVQQVESLSSLHHAADG